VLTLLLSLTTAAPHAQQLPANNGEFILRAPAALINDIAARHGLTVVRQLEGQDLFVVSQAAPIGTRTGNSVAALLPPRQTQYGDIASDPDVMGFEPNSIVATPEIAAPFALNGSPVSILDGLSDTHLVNYFDTQVWVRYVDQPATTAIGLAASHAAVGTGAGIVAIIDTGVDPNHPALAGALVPGYDFIHETAGIASEWSDVDGSVVSILDGSVVSILDGHAVTLNGSVVAILDQATAAALDPSTLPHAFGHGTMVAGLVHLVAPGARIMPLKAFSADGTSNVFDVVRAIYFAVDHGARVINMSFSSAAVSPEITHAINYATERGVVCVASAGNLGQETVVYPGGLRNVIGVGSTSSTAPATRSVFSNYGDALVSLGAPGEAVITTYPGAHFAAAWARPSARRS
jgi:subtilisin family serine protease